MRQKPVIGISAVERETGILKETLRIWEQRYGFPRPVRTSSGDRLYSLSDVAKLKLLKRLIDRGHRPGAIVALSLAKLRSVVGALAAARAEAAPRASAIQAGIDLLKASRFAEFRHWIHGQPYRIGLRTFVLEVARDLTEEVGAAWERGDIAVFQEHFFTEQLTELIRGRIGSLPSSNRSPAIVLTTLPYEEHTLGLLMAEALLAVEGAFCVALGAQTPVEEIVQCARDTSADIVALSFSNYYPTRKALSDLRQLRSALPKSVGIWAGGAATRRLSSLPPGTSILPELEDGVRALEDWRRTH